MDEVWYFKWIHARRGIRVEAEAAGADGQPSDALGGPSDALPGPSGAAYAEYIAQLQTVATFLPPACCPCRARGEEGLQAQGNASVIELGDLWVLAAPIC